MDAAERPAPEDAAPRPPLSERLQPRRMVRLGFAFFCVPTCMAWFARLHWLLDLATHFAVQSAVLMALFLAVFLIWRQWIPAGIAAVGLLWNGALIVPVWFGRPAADASGPRVKLLSANVHTGNRNTQAFLDLVEREDPDIVLAIEVDDRWLVALQPLKQRYPRSIERGRLDNFGIALYTRLDVDSLQDIEFADSEVPTIVARLRVDSQSLTLYGTHTLPPIGAEYSGLRNRHLLALAERALHETSPAVVAGDLNVTPWSPHFTDLLKHSGLHDTRQGFGIHPTWPTSSPLIRIPIDHVLVSDRVAVLERHVADDFGSDHFPVIVTLGLPSAPQP